MRIINSDALKQQTVPKILKHTWDLEKVAMQIRFRTMLYLCLKKRPLDDFQDLMQLQERNRCFLGLESVCKSDKTKYTSKRFQNEVVNCLASVIRERSLGKVSRSTFLCPMGDETTDRATTSQMVFLYRTADPFVGKPEIVFSSIEALHHGGSADAVTATTLSCLERDSVPLSRCCSFCGDGCGVIIGCKNGLAARFCARNPYMLFNHCFCHRCALGLVTVHIPSST